MSRLISPNKSTRKIVAIVLPAFICWLLTALSTMILKDYGTGVFIFVPFFIGVASTVLYGYNFPSRKRMYLGVTSWSLLLYCIGLILFAMEGAICIIMAAPLGLVMSYVGTFLGEGILRYKNSSLPAITALGFFIPALMGFEYKFQTEPALFSTTTSVIINATPDKVWKEVIAFSKIGEPTEWFFKAGIAYPTHAEIVGSGAGAIRYCNFSTGRFVEPITIWDENKLLQFSVLETPAPMKEISPYDIEPAHLHNYFISKKGQFKLTVLKNGQTLLEGTTWYNHKIKPAFYWKHWSNYIIHTIHNRVLKHIKKEVESVSPAANK